MASENPPSTSDDNCLSCVGMSPFPILEQLFTAGLEVQSAADLVALSVHSLLLENGWTVMPTTKACQSGNERLGDNDSSPPSSDVYSRQPVSIKTPTGGAGALDEYSGVQTDTVPECIKSRDGGFYRLILPSQWNANNSTTGSYSFLYRQTFPSPTQPPGSGQSHTDTQSTLWSSSIVQTVTLDVTAILVQFNMCIHSVRSDVPSNVVTATINVKDFIDCPPSLFERTSPGEANGRPSLQEIYCHSAQERLKKALNKAMDVILKNSGSAFPSIENRSKTHKLAKSSEFNLPPSENIPAPLPSPSPGVPTPHSGPPFILRDGPPLSPFDPNAGNLIGPNHPGFGQQLRQPGRGIHYDPLGPLDVGPDMDHMPLLHTDGRRLLGGRGNGGHPFPNSNDFTGGNHIPGIHFPGGGGMFM